MKISMIFYILFTTFILFSLDLLVNFAPMPILVHVGHIVLFLGVSFLLYNGTKKGELVVKL